MWVYIDHIQNYVGQEVTIKGWLYNIRSAGKLLFPELRDGTGVLPGVVSKKEVSEKVWADFEKLTQESSLIVKGTVTKHPKKENVFETFESDERHRQRRRRRRRRRSRRRERFFFYLFF